MKKDRSYESITTPPEFESRCNMFVDHVESLIVPKYPEIGITSKNITTEGEPALPTWMEEVFKRVIYNGDEEKWKKRQNRRTELNRISDLIGLSENTATVQLWGWEGEKAIPQLESVIKEIIKTAENYNGVFTREKDEGDIIDIESPELPNSYLRFLFK
jgi:hypothetical protein